MSDHRQVIRDAINHRQPSRTPLDFGGCNCTGIHCSVVEGLREHYGLEKRPIQIQEVSQLLGTIDPDLREAMGLDVVIAPPIGDRYGTVYNGKWKEWRAPWGQVVLLPDGLELETVPGRGVLVYPQGDRSAPPSGIMAESSYFFDSLERQDEYDEDDLDPADNLEEFKILSDATLEKLGRAARAARATGRAVMNVLPGTPLGNIAYVPATEMKHPKGIRAVADWYMITATRPDYVHRVFEKQTEIALENLKRLYGAIGDDYDVVFICGTDFGTQTGQFCSSETYMELYHPYYRRMNDWIHANTPWKTVKHSCGAVDPFIEGFIESGFDILNPVQCSAAGMEPAHLKEAYGSRIVFWGAAGDTQQSLPFGTPERVREEVLERCRIFSPGGGFVCSSIHNVQALTPVENMVAFVDAVREFDRAGKA